MRDVFSLLKQSSYSHNSFDSNCSFFSFIRFNNVKSKNWEGRLEKVKEVWLDIESSAKFVSFPDILILRQNII